MALAREAGDRAFDAETGICLISRDTFWYAASLLFDDSPDRRDLGHTRHGVHQRAPG